MEARHTMLRDEGRAKFLSDLARNYNRRPA